MCYFIDKSNDLVLFSACVLYLYLLCSQGWTERQFFEAAEDFFMSVGLYEMFENFWSNSMFVKPDDGRQVVCHPTAWDMGNREDFRYEL